MTQELINLDRYSTAIDSNREIEGFKLIRIPVGTFGGTVERVYLVKEGHAHAFNTGDQGGGQS
jgi:hypothetical protein